MPENPISIEAFAAFCESKPAGEAYSYINRETCAFAQYVRTSGFANAEVGAGHWFPDADDLEHLKMPSGVHLAARDFPWTFGALSTRLRQHMETKP